MTGHPQIPDRMPARQDLERWALPASSVGLAASTAMDLVRVALLAKLAVDLDDPRLARRAAREAQSAAHLLAGLDWRQRRGLDDDQADDDALPQLDVLLERRYGVAAEQGPLDDEAAAVPS